MKSLSRRQSTARLVARLLDDPGLAERVRSLSPAKVHELVRLVGLEDSGELVALASPDQLTSLFDADLWTSSAPGEEEVFDGERFVTWLEVLAEHGVEQAALRLAKCSEDFLALALSRLLLVLETEVVRRAIEDDDSETADKLLSGQPSEEIGEYLVVARRQEGWDTLLGILLAWDRDDHELCERLLSRLAHAGEREVDDGGGLSEVLSDLETLEEDAAAEREERRAKAGFVDPRSAAAFLRLARRPPPATPEEDAISRAHFRALAPERVASQRATQQRVASQQAKHASVDAPLLARSASGSESLLELFALASEEARGGLPELAPGPSAASPLRQALRALSERDPARHARLLEELAFLSNALVSGDEQRRERWRPQEALAEVARIVERVLPADEPQALAELKRWGLIGLFRRGYAR